MSISQFFSTLKESQFNILEVYSKAPNETLIAFAIILLIVLVAVFLIARIYKINNLINTINTILETKTYEEYDEKISFIAQDISKRGKKTALHLNSLKEKILFKISKQISTFSIKEKIDVYKSLSKNYSLIANACEKYNETELIKFYERKSKELLEKTLKDEIEFYYKNVDLTINEIDNINAVVKYINTLNNKDEIFEQLLKEFSKFSFGYNLDLYKFIEKLEIKEAKQVYRFCRAKIDEIEQGGQKELSINILEYLLNNWKEEKAYNYISNLKLKSYLQQLHDQFFNKKDDLNLDLSFIANPLKIDSDYKNYIDNSLTRNWRDSKHIEFISNSKGVLETLGHMEFRTLIERVDSIAANEENKKVAQEALKIAKRAETIALEAKSLRGK
ncbi:hypothetical protein CRV08_07765 [Halarcobacter ebronensis]|uniref:Uncharacterized protein n=1 Tax=Halarcobacter ebronensis TaxID=1462615 RepID=A0A4Q0YCM4_9BACT|nr:hypothetical protein [Halarcobacter ebronensis]RXJ68147.1 hypothetical protein CRV08_07765 [Halarcobacter ebronensis]